MQAQTPLAELLRQAGSTYDPDGVRGLIEGVLAAPPAVGTSWHILVADPVPAELAAALEALKAEMARDRHDGLGRADFVCLPRAARLAARRVRCRPSSADPWHRASSGSNRRR